MSDRHAGIRNAEAHQLPGEPEAVTVVQRRGARVPDTLIARSSVSRRGSLAHRVRAPDGRTASLRRRIRLALLPPLAAYTVTALLQVAALAWMIPSGQGGVRDKLLSWDARWYMDIAANGYPAGLEYDEEGDLKGGTLAYFPLYPALIRLVHLVTRLDYEESTLWASRVAGVTAAVAVYHLFVSLYDRKTALVATVLVCAQPMSVTLAMGYTEGLFLACAAATLLAVRREAWLLAGGCALLAGLTRSTGLAVAAALVTAAGWQAWRRRRLGYRMVTGCLIGCAGVPAYLLWVAARTGRVDGWMAIQEAGWGTHWDWGVSAWRFFGDTFHGADGWVSISTALLLIVTAVCCAIAVLDRAWPPLVVYGLLVLALTVGQSNYYHSKLRLLVPALLALIPVAVALTRARPRTAGLLLAMLALFGTWYGAYMLTTWRYAV